MVGLLWVSGRVLAFRFCACFVLRSGVGAELLDCVCSCVFAVDGNVLTCCCMCPIGLYVPVV